MKAAKGCESRGGCEGWGVREAVKSRKVSGCLGDSGCLGRFRQLPESWESLKSALEVSLWDKKVLKSPFWGSFFCYNPAFNSKCIVL